MKNKVILITGGSSGIGKAAAEALLARGCTVYEGSRRVSNIPGVTHLCLDVTDERSAREAVNEVVAREGRIDVLINCAGAGISGAVEFTEHDRVRWQLDVLFMGVDNMTRAALPHMRLAGGGRIVNISSVAAEFPIPFQTYYSASKAAVNAYSASLANEVRPFGITVTAVQPGDIKTGFTAAREKSAAGDDVYGGRIARSVERMEKDEQNGMTPEYLGRFVARVALKKRVRPLYTAGPLYRLLCLLGKILPQSLITPIVGKLYMRK